VACRRTAASCEAAGGAAVPAGRSRGGGSGGGTTTRQAEATAGRRGTQLSGARAPGCTGVRTVSTVYVTLMMGSVVQCTLLYSSGRIRFYLEQS
jgi:hypothetical protein